MMTNLPFIALPPTIAELPAVLSDASLDVVGQSARLMALTVEASRAELADDLSAVTSFAVQGDARAREMLAVILGSQGALSRIRVPYQASVSALNSGDTEMLLTLQGTRLLDTRMKAPATGDAEFLPMGLVSAYLRSTLTNAGERVLAGGLMVFDSAMPADIVSPFADRIRRMDHHGDMASSPENSVGQLVSEFRRARAKVGITSGENVDVSDPRIDRAVADLNLRFVTTDNLADGVDAVLMARHQRKFLADPELLDLYERAIRFVDFDAFGPGHAGKPFDSLPDAVVLALASYRIHDMALASPHLKFAGADRFAPENARPIVEWELPRLLEVIEDVEPRRLQAREIWKEVLDGAEHARRSAVVESMSVDGHVVGYFYDNAKMAGRGYFAAQMAFARAHPDAPFYVKVINAPVAGVAKGPDGDVASRILICAIPYGRTFPNGDLIPNGLLAALRKAHEEKARALGVNPIPPADKWAVRDDMIVTVGGAFLEPKDVKRLMEEDLAHLFRRG